MIRAKLSGHYREDRRYPAAMVNITNHCNLSCKHCFIYRDRGGELAHGLIDRLNDQGIRVVVISGYDVVPLAPGKAVAILQKPVVEAQLLAALRPATALKTTQ